MGAVTEDAFCLKWNDFHTSLTSSFAELREESDLLDATVVCDGTPMRAHKLVLSACSGVFRQLFRSSSSALGFAQGDHHHPVILLWDVKADDLKLLFNFMYEGQVNVAQERLSTFLTLAERLQVRGLTSTTGDGVLNRTAAVAAVKSIVPLVTPTVPLPVVAGTIPVVNSQATVGGQVGRRIVGQRVPGLTQAPNLNKRARTTLLHPERDGTVGQAGTLDAAGNSIQIKQEMKLDGEGSYEHAAAAVATNSLHPTGFSALGQPGQPTTVAAFNTYYEAGASNNADNDAHGNSAFHPDGTSGGIVHTGEGGFELQTSLLSDKVVGVSSATAAAVAQAAVAAAAQAAAAGQSGTVQNALELGQVQQTPGGTVPASVTNTIGGTNTTSRSQHGHQNNSGVCHICNKSFRQLRSHIQDVHNPTATPCPLCGKVFQSKHKMFGHKYRSCPNRTRNLVRHLEDIDPANPTAAGGTTQPSQTPQLVAAVTTATPQQAQPGQQQAPQQQAAHPQQQQQQQQQF